MKAYLKPMIFLCLLAGFGGLGTAAAQTTGHTGLVEWRTTIAIYNHPAQLVLTNKNRTDMWVKFRFDGGPELKYTVAAYSSKTYTIPNYSNTVQCTSSGPVKELHSVYA